MSGDIQPGRFEAIQVLRAVAAILVLQTHTLMIYNDRPELPRPWQGTAGALKEFGSSGVDMFFVISGFIMALAVASRRPGEASSFLAKRFIRVAPIYWLTTLIFVPAMLLVGRTFEGHSFLDSLTIFPTRAALPYVVPVLWVGWTLAFELAFYLIIALSMRISGKHDNGVQNSLMLVCILAFIGHLWSPENNLLSVFFNTIWLDFAFGIMVYLVWENLPNQRRFWNGVGLAVFGVISLGYSGAAGFPFGELPQFVLDHDVGAIRALWWGLPSAFLMLGLLYMVHEANPATLRDSFIWRQLLRIGDASYSLYLLHLGVAFAFLQLMPTNQIDADLMMCFIIGLNIVLALAAFRWLEQPLLDLLRRKLLSPTPKGQLTTAKA